MMAFHFQRRLFFLLSLALSSRLTLRHVQAQQNSNPPLPSPDDDPVLNFHFATIVQQCGTGVIEYTLSNAADFHPVTQPITLTFYAISSDGAATVITNNAPLTGLSGSFTWNPINILGSDVTYTLEGFDTDKLYNIAGESDAFTVRPPPGGQTGNCLVASTAAAPSTPGGTQIPAPSNSASNTNTLSKSVTKAPTSTSTKPASTTPSTSGIAVPDSAISSSHLSNGAKAGIAIAVIILVLSLASGAYFFLLARRRSNATRQRRAVTTMGARDPFRSQNSYGSGGEGGAFALGGGAESKGFDPFSSRNAAVSGEWKEGDAGDYAQYSPRSLTESDVSHIVPVLDAAPPAASNHGLGAGAGIAAGAGVMTGIGAYHAHEDALGRSIGPGNPQSVSTFSEYTSNSGHGAGYLPPGAGPVRTRSIDDAPSYLGYENTSSADAVAGHSSSAVIAPASSTSTENDVGAEAGAVVAAPVKRNSKDKPNHTPRKPVPVYKPSSEDLAKIETQMSTVPSQSSYAHTPPQSQASDLTRAASGDTDPTSENSPAQASSKYEYTAAAAPTNADRTYSNDSYLDPFASRTSSDDGHAPQPPTAPQGKSLNPQYQQYKYTTASANASSVSLALPVAHQLQHKSSGGFGKDMGSAEKPMGHVLTVDPPINRASAASPPVKLPGRK